MALLTVAVLPGCGGSGFEVENASGVLTIDNKPFPAGQIVFSPIEKPGEIEGGKMAIAVLDNEGRFELSTYKEGDGAVVGKHWVTLYPLDDRRTAEHRSIPKFSRLSVVEQPVEVFSGKDNTYEFKLTSSQIKKAVGG